MIRDSSATEKLRGLDDQSGGGYQQYSEGRGNETNNSGTEGQPNKPRSLIELYCGPVNYDLLISKIFYFFFFAAFGSLFPLISVYFKQLGMNATQAGILIGIRPFIEYASAPFWGSFGERFRKGKALLLGSLVCWIVFTVSLAFLTPYVTYCSSRNTTLHFNYLFRVENADAKAIQMENDLAEMNPERQSFRIETRKPGLAPVVVNALNYPNYEPSDGDLVKPPYSTKIYRKSGVEEMFLLLLLLTVIGVFFSAPAISLADSCTLAYLGDQPELYGKQRLFGSLGWGLAMFFVGIALDNSKAFATQACPRMDDREKNYVLCFAVFSVLMSCALIAATQFRIVTEDRTDKISQKIFDSQLTKVAPAVQENLRARAPEPQEMGGGPKWLSVLKTYRSPHYAAFLFVAFWFGVGIGLVFAFLFWHLQDIGGTSSLFGVASVVNHVSEIVAYFFSFKLINKVGHMRVLYIGLAANCARFLYVSWLKEPWWILPFEFIQGLTHSAIGATITSYVSLTAPPNIKSSAQALVDALHMGVGRGIGALICGIVITYEGTVVVFRAYGFISLIIAGLFFVVNRFLKVDAIKYQASDLLEEAAIGPHGVPMRVNYSPSEEQLANNYSAGYGTLDDPTQEAYDRYIHEPYDKPVKFEAINIGGNR